MLAAIGAVIVACTESVKVGPEGQFSWEPETQLVWPVQGAIVSAYGDAARPGHRGVDLAAPPGASVAAARLGKVDFVGEIAGYGRTLVLSHGDRLSTVYAHLGTVRVSEGDAVSRGQTIGTISPEGYLHYEIRDAAQPVDPAGFYAVAPQPAAGVSLDVQKKIAEEPSSVGTLGVLGAEPAPAPTAQATFREMPRPAATPAPQAPAVAPATATPPTPRPTATPRPTPTPRPSATPWPTPTPRPMTTPRATPAPRSREAAASSRWSTPMPTVPPVAAPTEVPAPVERSTGESAAGSGDRWEPLRMGALLLGSNLVYVPVKLAYSAIGAVTGTIALVLAHDGDVANSIWVPTMRGDYVVTAEHLRGETPLQFRGSPP